MLQIFCHDFFLIIFIILSICCFRNINWFWLGNYYYWVGFPDLFAHFSICLSQFLLINILNKRSCTKYVHYWVWSLVLFLTDSLPINYKISFKILSFTSQCTFKHSQIKYWKKQNEKSIEFADFLDFHAYLNYECKRFCKQKIKQIVSRRFEKLKNWKIEKLLNCLGACLLDCLIFVIIIATKEGDYLIFKHSKNGSLNFRNPNP